jgi:hypothetical protein
VQRANPSRQSWTCGTNKQICCSTRFCEMSSNGPRRRLLLFILLCGRGLSSSCVRNPELKNVLSKTVDIGNTIKESQTCSTLFDSSDYRQRIAGRDRDHCTLRLRKHPPFSCALASVPTPSPLQYFFDRTVGDPQPFLDGWGRVTHIASRCTQISGGLAVMFGTWLGVGQSPRSSTQHIGWLKARRVRDVTDDFTVRHAEHMIICRNLS